MSKLKSKEAIYIALGLILILELVWAARTFFTDTQFSSAVEKIQPLSGATIVLDAPVSSTGYKAGDMVPVTVKVVTGGRSTESTDLILKYDPEILDVDKVNTGSMYPEYPLNTQEKGVVRVSGITKIDQSGVTGLGQFATVNFKAKKDGVSDISVEFGKDQTTDSNVIESGTIKDILSNVVNTKVTVGTPTSPSQSSSSKVCQGYTQYCQNDKGQVGTQYCSQGMLLDDNTCTFDPTLTTSCSVCEIR